MMHALQSADMITDMALVQIRDVVG